MKLQGKSIVVTGASSGMGKAIVELFVKEGANVVAVARRQERLEALEDAFAGEAGKIVAFTGDVSKQADSESMIDIAVERFGKLDVLVNNAGVMDDMSPIGELTNETLERIYGINVFGPFYSMRKAVNVFLAQGGGGNIINIASMGYIKTVAGPAYCSSKAAIVSLTRNTAFMYMPQRIRCNAIAPGGISTEISASMGIPSKAGYERVKAGLAAAPKELGKAEDIAMAALFLASDDSAYISGDVMCIDGGWNAV